MQTQKDSERKSGKLVMSGWSLGILTPFWLCRGLFRNRCNRTVRRLEPLSCGTPFVMSIFRLTPCYRTGPDYS